MVKLEYRPYLLAVLGLTVCVSLYEIAYIQSTDDGVRTIAEASPLVDRAWDKEAGVNNETVLVAGESSDHSSTKTQSKEIGPPNRGILSSNHIPDEDSSIRKDISKFLSTEDYHTLIDLDQFGFIIDQKPCTPTNSPTLFTNGTTHKSPSVLVLILIHSAPQNFRKRLTIRQTWGSLNDPGLRIMFLLGAVSKPKLQSGLEMENQHFGDILQGNFSDSYRNITYKHVMALKWFTYNCADTPIMLKTDDDVFVNTPALMDYVRWNVTGIRARRNLLKCRVIRSAPVKRSFRSKWRVSPKEYPFRVYPPYCPGFILMYSGDLVPLLYREAQAAKYFWIDDVHITGTLMRSLRLPLSYFKELFFRSSEKDKLTEPYVNRMPIFCNPDLKEVEIRKMWSMLDEKNVNTISGPSFLATSQINDLVSNEEDEDKN